MGGARIRQWGPLPSPFGRLISASLALVHVRRTGFNALRIVGLIQSFFLLLYFFFFFVDGIIFNSGRTNTIPWSYTKLYFCMFECEQGIISLRERCQVYIIKVYKLTFQIIK